MHQWFPKNDGDGTGPLDHAAAGILPAAGRLRTLSWLHYAWAAFGIVGLGVTAVYGLTIWPMMPGEYLTSHGDPLPEWMLSFVPLMKAWVFVVAAFQLAMMALNLLVARWLVQRRRWFLCAAVSAVNCIRIVLGPVVGVPTLIVLNQPGVRRTFR